MNLKIILGILLLCLVFIQGTGVAGALSLTEVGSYNIENAQDITVSGSYAYIADGIFGLVIIDISNPAAPTLAGRYDTAGNAKRVTVSGNYAYVADLDNGLVIIDISNPAAPTLAGRYDTARNAWDIAVSGNYAYVADDTNGLVIIDISNPAAPTLAGRYDTAGEAGRVAVSGSYAYVGDGTSLVIIDISNPAAPRLAGSYHTGKVFGVAVSGNYAYVADLDNGLVITDISNPAAPTLAGRYYIAGRAFGVAVSGNYAYVVDLDNGLVIIDISNPAAPTLADRYDAAGKTGSVAVSGSYAYVATINGIVIIDIGNPAAVETQAPTTGSIAISSIPSGASIYLDGTYKGTTPTVLTDVPKGSHTIKLTKSGYTAISKTITVLRDKPVQISETLNQVATVETAIAKETAKPSGGGQPYQNNDNTIVLIIFALFVGIVFIAVNRREKSNKSSKVNTESDLSKLAQPSAEKTPVTAAPAETPIKTDNISIKTAFGYKGATIIFKLKIENNTSNPISDIRVYPYVPDVFLLKEKDKSISLIEPNSSQTVTFEIRPTGECGDCNISGRVNYYDMVSRKRQDIELEPKSLSVICPMLHGKEISGNEWHDAVGNLVKTEESTGDIYMPAESLFAIVSRIVKDMNMYMQKPEITENQQLFNGVARFYAEGIRGLKYAAQVEVIGGAKKSKLILKVWAEKEDALTGFYHGVLDEIEKRVNVKEYIQDSIVQQYNIQYGDKIGTQVRDSVVQRSNIGAGEKRECPNCGREAGDNEKFCLECGEKLGV